MPTSETIISVQNIFFSHVSEQAAATVALEYIHIVIFSLSISDRFRGKDPTELWRKETMNDKLSPEDRSWSFLMLWICTLYISTLYLKYICVVQSHLHKNSSVEEAEGKDTFLYHPHLYAEAHPLLWLTSLQFECSSHYSYRSAKQLIY